MSTLFFLTGLTDKQVERLEDAAVRFSEQQLTRTKTGYRLWNRERTETVSGLLLDQENYNKALEFLGAVEAGRDSAAEPNMVMPKLRFSKAPKPVVAVYAWLDGKTPDAEPFVQIVRETLLPQAGTDIVIHATGKAEYQKPLSDGLLHLHLWSTPKEKGEPDVQGDTVLFGIRSQNTNRMFRPSGNGAKLFDDNANVVGELVGRSDAYAFFDAVRKGTPQELAVFRRFCEELDALRHLDAAAQARRQANAKTREYAERRSKYLEVCNFRVQRETEEARIWVATAEAAVKKAQNAYLAALSSLDRAQERLTAYESGASSVIANLTAEFDRFHNDPKFVRVVPEEKVVHVYTRTLYFCLADGSAVYRAGEMRIDILLDRENASQPIRVFNMTKLRNGKGDEPMHPHISSDGRPCLGTSESLFVELVRNREIYAAASYAVQYVESLNTSTASAVTGWTRITGAELTRLYAEGALPAKAAKAVSS